MSDPQNFSANPARHPDSYPTQHSPAPRKPVAIGLVSVQQDGELRAVTEREHHGTLYERDGAHYLLYDDEGTATTLRLASEEIRIYRRGAEMISWQVFQLGEITGGRLVLGAGEMMLGVMTSHFSLQQDGQAGRVELHYELFTAESAEPDADPMGLSLGKFELAMDGQARA